MDSPTLTLLKSATKNLLYPSETDAPFTLTESATPYAPPPNTTIEIATLADIFDEGDSAFTSLRHLIEQNLTGIRVLRLGKVTITIIITGTTKSNTHLILQTLSVETG